MTQTERVYAYHRFLPIDHNRNHTSAERSTVSINHKWRASICKWSYNVTDYFDMSREVVAISMKLFDNYFATRRCVCDKGLILLASIATLHIAIKIRESVVIRLETLCRFGRGYFTPDQITRMELVVLTHLTWLVNPPTAIAFAAHMILLLPSEKIDPGEREDLYESSRYLAELSVADSFFIDRALPSVTAFASILISLEECVTTLSSEAKTEYLQFVKRKTGISDRQTGNVMNAKNRLRLLKACNEE
eukprot:CAMPEP_0171340016 /NCGR_PEP_ID=MMETSP0878-20121228/8301_1 /TAXON_ID=67004 /ORGANISM="Thalassiosira weissflogii, Strain CCMP1336" /LENGTH=247 /DNA_ID=CAMNT_0011842017 /DNA_START=222 /DNA_END=965 /DNA_ORIENTATION=-